MNFTEQWAALRDNPPRLRSRAAEVFNLQGRNRRSITLFVVEIYSPTLGDYMVQAERTTRQEARAELSDWNRDYLRTLRALRKKATTN